MAKIAVIGGGLAGLCAAHTLLSRKHTIVLLEAAGSLGGQIQTVHAHGHCIELGAEGFVKGSEALPKLAHALGLHRELLDQSCTRSLGYRAGTLRELSPGEAATFLGFQVAKRDLGSGIRTFTRGMGSLITELARALEGRIELRTDFSVQGLERKARTYHLLNQDGAYVEAERVVVATAARPAARLLTGLMGHTAEQLAGLQLSSSVTVSLAWDRGDVPHPLDATGFVVAEADQEHGIRACTFTTSKFAQRAPSGKVSLRVFFRPSDTDIKLLSDQAYSERAAGFLRRVLSIDAAPEHSWVSRWPSALPVFDDAHRARVASLEQGLSGSGVVLAGSAFHGAGIDAAVRSASSVAARL